ARMTAFHANPRYACAAYTSQQRDIQHSNRRLHAPYVTRLKKSTRGVPQLRHAPRHPYDSPRAPSARRRPFPRRLLLRRRLLRHLLPPLPLTLLLSFLVSTGPLDDRDRRRIAVAQAELDDARVSTGPVGKSRSDHLEELRHRLVVANAVECAPAGVQRRLLAERHQPIGHAAQLLRLGIGGAY